MKYLITLFLFIQYLPTCENNGSKNGRSLTSFDIKNIETSISKKVFFTSFELMLISKGFVNVQDIDPTISVNLVYADTNNFTHQVLYPNLDKAYLQKEIAQKLARANNHLKEEYPHLTLHIFDAVRPKHVQHIMWDVVKGSSAQSYVAQPFSGSLHNYGCAVDISIYNTKTDTLLDMGSSFDQFSKVAQPRFHKELLKYKILSENQVKNRLLLKETMKKAGFYPILTEWWHFNGARNADCRSKYELIP